MSVWADMSRRSFLTGAFRGRNLALAATGGAAWAYVLGKSRGAEGHLRPPGAREEADFLAACIKCGQCVEACPFDTLSLAGAPRNSEQKDKAAGDDKAPITPYPASTEVFDQLRPLPTRS